MSPFSKRTDGTGTSPNRRKGGVSIGKSAAGKVAAATTLPAVARMNDLARRGTPTARHVIDTDALAAPWSLLTSQPFTDVGIHGHAGHLLIDLQSTGGSVRLQLTQRDLPVLLKTRATGL